MMNKQVKNMMYCALCACIIAMMSQVRIALPGVVPITLQTFAVYLVGSIQKPKEAAISTLVYVGLGIIGIPVFAGNGGINVLLGPSGGYIVSFPVIACIISLLTSKKPGIGRRIIALLIGTVICYTIGTLWFMYVMDATLIAALMTTVVPFLLGDTIKIVVAVMIAEKIYKYIN